MEYKYSLANGKLVSATNDNNIRWIELVSPTDEEIRNIIDTYNVPKDYLYDAMDPYEVPRVEGLDDPDSNLFILCYPIIATETNYYTRVVSIILLKDLIVTVRFDDSPIFEELKTNNFERHNFDTDIDSIVLKLAWLISKTFNNYLENIDKKIQEIENKIKSTTKTELLNNMIEIQRSLIHFRTGIVENGPVIESIFESNININSEMESELLHDLKVENKQAQIVVEKSVNMLENLTDLYSNVISNNLNTVVKGLTSITIVLTIPTIVGGLWGMNTELPIGDHPHAFWYLIIATIVISIIMIYILKKKDYL